MYTHIYANVTYLTVVYINKYIYINLSQEIIENLQLIIIVLHCINTANILSSLYFLPISGQ